MRATGAAGGLPYTRGRRTMPCACGCPVTADPLDPAPGVRAHQLTPKHRAWRASMEAGYRRAAAVVRSREYRHRMRDEVERVRVLREVVA